MLSTQFIDAQTVRGRVLDENFDPLIGVHVINLKSGVGTTTNLEGYFVIPAVTGDTLNISYVGYEELNHLIVTENPVIQLSLSTLRLKDFTVYGKRIGIKIHGMPPIEENLKIKSVEMGTDFNENPNMVPTAGAGATFMRKQYNDKKAKQERKLPEVIEQERKVAAYYELAEDKQFLTILKEVNPSIETDISVILVEYIAQYKSLVLSSSLEEVKASLLMFVVDLK